MNRLQFATLALAMACWSVAGCSQTKDDEFAEQPEGGHVEDSAHPAHGPHNGHVADLGTEYRAEVTFDAEGRRIVVYLLNHDNDEPAAIEPTEVTLFMEGHKDDEGEGIPLTKETIGEGEDAETGWIAAKGTFGTTVASVEDIHGHIHATVDGKELIADFEEAHGEDHEHGEGESHDEEK
jgi:hypothetical protein